MPLSRHGSPVTYQEQQEQQEQFPPPQVLEAPGVRATACSPSSVVAPMAFLKVNMLSLLPKDERWITSAGSVGALFLYVNTVIMSSILSINNVPNSLHSDFVSLGGIFVSFRFPFPDFPIQNCQESHAPISFSFYSNPENTKLTRSFCFSSLPSGGALARGFGISHELSPRLEHVHVVPRQVGRIGQLGKSPGQGREVLTMHGVVDLAVVELLLDPRTDFDAELGHDGQIA